MRTLFVSFVFGVFTCLATGCRSAPAPVATPAVVTTSAAQVKTVPRPDVAAPPIKLFHQTADSLTLVTTPDATDAQIEAILFELHDAARTHSFDKLGIPQKFVDARDPIVWFHLYRGAKCADEKYTTGKYPCGSSYHAAGDYTLGGFTDHNHDDGILIHDNGDETHLW